MATYKIAVVVGSLREGSYNRKIAKALELLAPDTLSFEYAEIGNLQLYNEDLDETPPESWVSFRKKISGCEGVLFVTPEYNRSVPGVLKNAIDIASRPYGKSVWDGKPAAVVSVSPSAVAGFGANHHLRQTMVFLNMPAMQQPEAYIGNVTEVLDDEGNIKSKDTEKFLKKFITAYAEWVRKHVDVE